MNQAGWKLLVPIFAIGMVSCKTTEIGRKDFLSSYDALEEQKGLDNARVFTGDLKRLKRYRKLYIEDVRVLAPTNGERRKDVQAEEAAQLANLFKDALEAEMGKSIKVVSRPGRSTLSLRVALTQMEASNPALFLASYAPYVSGATTVIGVATGSQVGAGNTKIQAEIVDSVTRERFYAIVDENEGNKLQLAGLKRWGHTEASFRQWSRRFRKVFGLPVESEEEVG